MVTTRLFGMFVGCGCAPCVGSTGIVHRMTSAGCVCDGSAHYHIGLGVVDGARCDHRRGGVEGGGG